MSLEFRADMADRVINHMHKLTVDKPGNTAEARQLAVESLRLAGFKNVFEPDVSKLIWALSEMKADRMTCMTAACLLLDYRTLETRRQANEPEVFAMSEVA